MKILSKFILLLLFSVYQLFGQNKRNGISYQALIIDTRIEQLPGYDNVNVPLVNSEICLSFSIIDENGSTEYREYVRTSTDALGMINEIIGNGQQISSNTWDEINWSSSSKSLKVELDIYGNCSQFETISNEPLTAVPFALYSAKSDIPGPPGKSAYDIWLENGNNGSINDFLESLIGEDGISGESAYEAWKKLGNEGDLEDFLKSLKGTNGESAYQSWLNIGNIGSETDFINSLKGANGLDGEDFSFDLPDGSGNGDKLEWVWSNNQWTTRVITPDNTSIILTSGPGTNNQFICQNDPISTISYGFTDTVSGVTVTGLPNGINFELNNNELSITGSITAPVDERTSFEYTVQLPQEGGPNKTAVGKLIFDPSPEINLSSGDQNLSSCLNEEIESVEYLLVNTSNSVNVTGLPPGINSSIVGNQLILSGTPDAGMADGSTFNYEITTLPGTCDPISIQGTMSFSDCSTCYPTANAGVDATICSGNNFNLVGNVGNATSINWSTSGNGTFNNPNIPNPIYIHTNDDLNNGSVTLTVRTENNSCGSVEVEIDSMVLNITNCNSITATLINNEEAIVFANDITFGAEIQTDNIQAISVAGLCYNTTGGPTTADNKVSQNYFNGGFWNDDPPVFEMQLNSVPVDSIFVRAYVETLGGDTIYGDQIAIANQDPNRNHIYNFTTTSSDFSPEDYEILTTSEFTFPNIISLRNLYWNYDVNAPPNYSNIVRINFPNLDRISQNLYMSNEFSLREFNAPKLRDIGRDMRIDQNGIEKIILPKLEIIGYNRELRYSYVEECRISKNNFLTQIDLSSLERSRYRFKIFDNQLLNEIILPNFSNAGINDSYDNNELYRGNGRFEIFDNQNLETLSMLTSNTFEGFIRIRDNPNLNAVNFSNVVTVTNGYIEIYSNPLLTDVDFSELVTVNGISNSSLIVSRIQVNNNPLLLNINFPMLVGSDEFHLKIADNDLLNNISLPEVIKMFHLEIYNENILSDITLPKLDEIAYKLNIYANNSLTDLILPSLITTGSNVFNQNSFYLHSNPQLNNIDLNNLYKVYTEIRVTNNNLLDVNNFPCNLFVFVNDGFDCTFDTITINDNLDNNYCFQDEDLIPPIDIITSPIQNITSDKAESGGTITSLSKMLSRGVVWSTTETPTLNDNYSENGNLNGNYTSYLYNLNPNTTYYVRAYGTDCEGTYYGNTISFTTNN
jgi:hypothetical protein